MVFIFELQKLEHEFSDFWSDGGGSGSNSSNIHLLNNSILNDFCNELLVSGIYDLQKINAIRQFIHINVHIGFGI